MRRSTRDLIGGLAILLLCVLAYCGLRFFMISVEDRSGEVSAEQRKAVAAFESDRLRDSARQQQHWDSLHAVWDAEKAERQTAKANREIARAQREQAYADSQRVWAARREKWAAEKAERKAAAEARQAHYDSIRASYPKKLPVGSFIDPNLADADQLMQIPGVGEVTARMIIEYRNSLGGFASARQVEEVKGAPHGLASWFRISSKGSSIKQININRADFKTLVHHPYLDYEQTKAIVNHRRLFGPIREWNDLRNSSAFSDSDFERLRPYFKF